MLPWTPFMLAAMAASSRRALATLRISDQLSETERQASQAQIDRFLWLWFLLPLIALCFVRAKHHHYLIHSLPPCSFWAAEGLLNLRGWAERLASRRRTVARSWAAGAVLVAVGVIYCRSEWPDNFSDALILGALLSLGGGAALAAIVRRRLGLALITVFAVGWVGYGYIHGTLMRKTDRYRDETAFLRRLNRPEHAGTHLLVYCYDPSRVLLYSRLPVELCVTYRQVRTRYDELPRAYLVTSMAQADQLRGMADVTCVDKMAARRWENLGEFAQLGAFRVQWRTFPPDWTARDRNTKGDAPKAEISTESAIHSP
jgi:hypothetical protein